MKYQFQIGNRVIIFLDGESTIPDDKYRGTIIRTNVKSSNLNDNNIYHQVKWDYLPDSGLYSPKDLRLIEKTPDEIFKELLK